MEHSVSFPNNLCSNIEVHFQKMAQLVERGGSPKKISQLSISSMDVLADFWQNNSRLSQELQVSSQNNASLSQKLEVERAIHKELDQKTASLQQSHQQLAAELQICKQQRNYFEQALQEMQGSIFWRITKPMRILLDRLKHK